MKCRLIDIKEYMEQGKHLEPGYMWYALWYLDKGGELLLDTIFSPEYKRDWFGKRSPIVVRLPNGHDFIPDIKFSDLKVDIRIMAGLLLV